MMMKRRERIKVSLIIATYNRPDALKVCLDSVLKQSLMPDEIIIGDDGSKENTKLMIDEMRTKFSVPLIHVWHSDEGFRLSKIRNKSIAKSMGDYIIVIDGDIMLHPHFIKDHLCIARKDSYIRGTRVNLTQKLTEDVCESEKSRKIHIWSLGIVRRRLNGLRIPVLYPFFAPRYGKNNAPGPGCNMSFWKSDFMKINGYDENFIGWGQEDRNFARRLQGSGVKKLYLKFGGIQYHLWHEENSRDNLDKNVKWEEEQRQKEVWYCALGADQYFSSGNIKLG